MLINIKRMLKKHPGLCLIARKTYSYIKLLELHIISIISLPFLLLPIQNNKIVISNYFGKGYGDNGKYIVEEIKRQNLDYDIVWLIKEDLLINADFPNEIRVVKYKSLKGLYELATAKIWIANHRKAFNPIKRKKQYYIQTWHGGIALKKVEKDVVSKLSPQYLRIAKRDSKMADVFVSNSSFCSDMYRKSFWYNNEILEVGSPRCDILLSEENFIVKQIKQYYSIDENSNILLYAPTFRNNESTDCYNIEFNNLINVLEKKFQTKWVIMIRLHPNISEQSNFMEYSSKIINVTAHDDMYELLRASDILITDYSSTMFEFSFMKKPVFLYAPDIEDYKRDRDFYFNIKKLPYKLATNNTTLIRNIEQFNKEIYLKQLKIFLNKLNVLEKGKASEEVVKRIKIVIEQSV